MCQKLLGDATLYALLTRIDEDLAAEVRAARCPLCGGPLHTSDYRRKPRGGPPGLGLGADRRLSFCCGVEGCRKRRTPPSVRFLGRRVYLGVVVVMVTALQSGLSAGRFQALREHLGVDRRTLARWRRWWRETLPASRFWRGARGHFAQPLDAGDFPGALLVRFGGDARARLVGLLRFLSPLTTSGAT